LFLPFIPRPCLFIGFACILQSLVKHKEQAVLAAVNGAVTLFFMFLKHVYSNSLPSLV